MTRSNPYIGPKAFQRDDSYLFCGRDYEVQKLLNLLIAEQILLLHAPSGAGKTSLINKAVIPKLEEKDFLVLPVMRVSRLLPAEILKKLKVKNRYVFSALLALEKFKEESAETYQLSKDELKRLEDLAKMTFLDYVKGVSEQLRVKRVEAKEAAQLANTPPENSQRVPSKIALIFDQFEEILSVDPTDTKDKVEFFKQVGDALFTENYWALFSMREDNAASLGSLVRQLPTRLETRFRLELLTTEKAEEAIKKPAESQNVTFKDDAVQQLINDLRKVKAQSLAGQTEEKWGDFVEPMQLQVVCYRLWEKLELSLKENKKEITTDDLQGTHVNEALAEFYEDCLRQVSQTGGKTEEDIRQWIEDELITPGETRGPVFMDQKTGTAAGMPKQIVEGLQGRHLLRGEYRAGAQWYELTHDRFIEPIKKSNRPWSALKIATRRAASAHTFAVLWFLAIALLWLFAEFFVTGPVRESRIFAAKNEDIGKERSPLAIKQIVIESVLAATEPFDQENANTDPTQLAIADQEKLATARQNVSNLRQIVGYQLKAVQPQKPQKSKKSRPAKKAKKELEDVEKLETALDESAPIKQTIAKLRVGNKRNWKDFSLADNEVATLKSLGAFLKRTSVNDAGANVRRRDNRRSRPPTAPSRASEPRTESVFPDFAKLEEGIKSVEQAQSNNDWTTLQLDLTTFENAAKLVIGPIRRRVEDLNAKNGGRLKRVGLKDLSNRGLGVAADERASQVLNAKFESTEDLKVAIEEPVQEIDRPTRIRMYLTSLWDSTIPAEQATTVLYLIWCVVLTAFIIYLTLAAVDLEERVGQFINALIRVKSVSDPLGWDIKRQTPSLLVMLALTFLLLIHVRVSWICINVVRITAGGNWWKVMFVPGVLAVFAIAYYVVEHYRHGQIARARILELMSSWNAINLSLRALTKR